MAITKREWDAMTITECGKKGHVQVPGTHFCKCAHVMFQDFLPKKNEPMVSLHAITCNCERCVEVKASEVGRRRSRNENHNR